jgi:outer membrane protein OmpA-like peptidoglycan-associated protein
VPQVVRNNRLTHSFLLGMGLVMLCYCTLAARPLSTSNRPDSLAIHAPDNAATAHHPKRFSRLAGRIINPTVESNAFIRVVLKNKTTGTLQETIADAEGKFHFDLETNADYTVTAVKTLAVTSEKNFRKPAFRLLPLGPKMLQIGDVITLDNLQYGPDKFSLLPRSTKELDRLVNTMKKIPSLHFEIGVHTDSRGNADFNNYLSQKRAQSIMDYFVSQGILKSRLKPKGYGETQLLNECHDEVLCTEAEHQRNQRVEFKVLLVK